MKEMYEALELDVVKQRIMHHCSFSLGKQKIRQLSPCFDELWVQRELARTQEAYDLFIRYGTMPFGGIYDSTQSIEAAKKDCVLSPQELRKIADSARACEHIKAYMKASEIESVHVQELLSSFHDNGKIAMHIEDCISINYEVLDNASIELKGIRKAIRLCSGDISKEVQRFIARHASQLMDTITTMRNERTCVLVKIAEKNKVDGFIHGESASGQAAYIEPQSLLILNNKLQSLKSKESEEINRILYKLSQEVKQIAHEVLSNLDTFAILDSMFAKAIWANEVDGCIGSVNSKEERLYLKQARHPLIDPKKVVANTYTITTPHTCLLITGSNTGGKSVALKTIGLFVAMTMCGLPVSADEASIPLFDALYVDIGDDQSIQESLSTFSSHISKLVYIAKRVSSRSFVLLDELGSGTDPKEGEALAIAVLDHFRMANAMVVATTHYSALKTYGANHEDVLLSSVEFDMEDMRPTYRYIEGISGQSNAFEIARRYGLEECIIQAAIKCKEQERHQSDIALEKIEALLLENHARKDKLEMKLLDVKALQEQLEKEKKIFHQDKERMLEKAYEASQMRLDTILQEAYALVEELKEKQDAKPHERTRIKTALDHLSVHEEQEEIEKEEVFQVGDYVQFKKLNYFGEILSIQKNKVCVFVNGMKMNTTHKELTHAKRNVQKKKKIGTQDLRVRSFSMECNVIGMRVNEAIPVIDKYLDNAILAKVYHVRIIHGMGTGALRKGVHEYLKRQPSVVSYQMGGQGEGGLGATVVELKQKGSA